MVVGGWSLAKSANDPCRNSTVGQSVRRARTPVAPLTSLATGDCRLAAALSRAAGSLSTQIKCPVTPSVLRFRNCARPSPPWRRYTSHRAGWLENRSLLLKEPVHGQICHHAPTRGGL